jgi:aspartate racemase
VKAVREEAQEAAWRLAYRSFRRRERPLPRALHDLQMYHREALREYRLRPYPGRVTVFRAAERGVSRTVDAQMGWGELALGGVEVYEVPGDHASLVKEPHVQVLAARLSACLHRAQADSEP